MQVVAVDPVHAASPAWLAEHAVEEAARGNRHTASSVDSFVWSFSTNITDHLKRRTTAARLFGDDLLAHPSAYVAGRLPSLPFRDASFDLVLSSHLLFMYADRLDESSMSPPPARWRAWLDTRSASSPSSAMPGPTRQRSWMRSATHCQPSDV